MRVMHETTGRIEVHTDSAGRILVSCMPIVEEKRPSLIEETANIMASIVSAGCGIGMLYLVARVAGII